MVGLSSMLKKMSRGLARTVPCLLALSFSAGLAFSAAAEPKPVVLIAGVEAAGNGTIAHQVYLAVINRLSRRISEMGYGIIASKNEAVANKSAEAAVGDQLLLREAAEDSQNPVKFIAAVQVFALTSIETIGTRIHIRIDGRIREAATGKLVETFVIHSPEELMAPARCNLKCVIATLIDNAALLADQLSSDLAPHLAPHLAPR